MLWCWFSFWAPAAIFAMPISFWLMMAKHHWELSSRSQPTSLHFCSTMRCKVQSSSSMVHSLDAWGNQKGLSLLTCQFAWATLSASPWLKLRGPPSTFLYMPWFSDWDSVLQTFVCLNMRCGFYLRFAHKLSKNLDTRAQNVFVRMVFPFAWPIWRDKEHQKQMLQCYLLLSISSLLLSHTTLTQF